MSAARLAAPELARSTVDHAGVGVGFFRFFKKSGLLAVRKRMWRKWSRRDGEYRRILEDSGFGVLVARPWFGTGLTQLFSQSRVLGEQRDQCNQRQDWKHPFCTMRKTAQDASSKARAVTSNAIRSSKLFMPVRASNQLIEWLIDSSHRIRFFIETAAYGFRGVWADDD
ncbi:hypothetical protein [Burkholderia gladioli]|uniref:hypothetical protein n=1 Tax=Burkholderia gladioli TaxID=28095 RepID=UPI002FDF82FF